MSSCDRKRSSHDMVTVDRYERRERLEEVAVNWTVLPSGVVVIARLFGELRSSSLVALNCDKVLIRLGRRVNERRPKRKRQVEGNSDRIKRATC
jgi:hypothetical protein